MKLLLDECLPIDFRHEILGHQAITVVYQGWKGVTNGQLLALAAAAAFDALVTTDQGMAHQHNPATLPLSIIILHAPSNDLDDLKPLIPKLQAALSQFTPRSIIQVTR